MKRIVFFFLLLMLSAAALEAQPIRKSTYENMIEVAEERMAAKDYYNALEWYEKAYEEKEDRSLLPIIAEMHYQLRDFRRAERAYERLLRRTEDNEMLEERFILGRIYKMNEQYNDAIEELQKFIMFTTNDSLKTLAQAELTGAEMAKEMGKAAKGVTIENLGRDINTKISEYSPVFAVDNSDELYYVSFNVEEDDVIFVDENNTNFHTKIFRTQKEERGWSKPTALGTDVNRPGVNVSHVSFSPDGRRMFYTQATLSGNKISESKIYYSEGGDGGWGPGQEVQGVNGDWVAQHPMPGELFGREVLFFVSDMTGGYGGLDLYYATYEGEGKYSDPVNLGDQINSPGDEVTPFYRDGTLYYSSNGLPTIGGYDIFYSVWDGTSWSQPENMTSAYNSSVDDYYFTLDTEGYAGYLTSNRPGGRSAHGRTCCDDIYSFEIARLYADLAVGTITEADGKKEPLIGATVSLIDLTNNQPTVVKTLTNEEANRFDFALELEKSYKVVGVAEGYFPDSATLNTVGLKESKNYRQFLNLKKKPELPKYDTIRSEEPIVLENILYDFDDDRIKEEAESDLQVVLELLEQYPDMKIELRSHTDNRGNDSYNEDLSQRRAESARRWLAREGIDRERIEARGYGEKVPQTVNANTAAQYDFLEAGDLLTGEFIDSLETEEQREIAHNLNRRTEFQITEGPTTIVIESVRLRKKEAPDRKALPQAGNDPEVSKLSSLHGQTNLKGLPIMTFNTRYVDFGAVPKGEKRYHSFHFTNTGESDLTISLVSACECTIADYSVRPVKPGESGVIDITFDSSEKDAAELIEIDIILDNNDNQGNPIIERIQYEFDIVEE